MAFRVRRSDREAVRTLWLLQKVAAVRYRADIFTLPIKGLQRTQGHAFDISSNAAFTKT
jgi:ribosomal protein L20